MNYKYPFLFIALLFLISFTLPAQSTPSFQDQVLSLHQEKFQWMVEKDTARLAELIADDVEYVHSNGWHEGREEMLTNIGSGRLRYSSIEVLEAAVRQYDQTFIVNGRAKFDVALEDQAWLLTLDYTEVYFLQNETLRLVSRHASRVPEP